MELHAVRGPRLPSHSGDHIEGHRILADRLGERGPLRAINDKLESNGLRNDHLLTGRNVPRPLDIPPACRRHVP